MKTLGDQGSLGTLHPVRASAREAVVLPVYEEAETVGCVLDAVRRHFDGLVIVVDDGSADETPNLLRARDDLVVLTHAVNRGYGQSLIDGMSYAHAHGIEHVVTMDCDGQHEPSHVRPFLDALAASDVEIVSGSRYLPESPVIGTAPPRRREVNARVTSFINDVAGFGLTDAFCGLKAYRVAPIVSLALREPGYAMPMELWAKAHRAGLRVAERAIERIYHDQDRSFGADLDDHERRFAYYLRVWEAALAEAVSSAPVRPRVLAGQHS